MRSCTRRDFLRATAVGAVAAGLTPSLAWADDAKSQKLNIILVMTDDQGYGDLSCHGHPDLKTPNLDKLHAQSTRFTSFHASPTCSPTRSALMTGLAPFKNGVTHTIFERERLSLDRTTIAQVLKSAGYTTGIFGKWHLGDEDAYQPHNRGFDETFIHGGGGIGQKYRGSCADAAGNSYFDPFIKHNNAFVKTSGYCTDVFFRQALGWIKTCKDANKPFFAYIPTNAPHAPYNVDDKYKTPYADKYPKAVSSFYGMIANFDQNMGLLMQKLDEWGLSENTLLIFMTDNGSAAGTFDAGTKGKKGSSDEGGSRVPLFMRLPGKIKPGVDVDRMTRHYDLFPTLAEFAGAQIPRHLPLDGRSLYPLIDDPKCAWEDRFTFFHVGRWGKKGIPQRDPQAPMSPEEGKYRGFAVRSQEWRLVGRDELYEINKDPGQTHNVIADRPDVAKKMLDAYENWWTEVRPLMTNEDAPLAAEHPFIVQFEKQKAEQGIPDWTPPSL